jgi:hypothetical protein
MKLGRAQVSPFYIKSNMDILNQKKQAFAEILNQYNITPLKVEQSETDYGLAFYFESKGTPDP